MSIQETFQKIKHLTPSAHASTPLLDKERGQGGEVYGFDNSGHIEHSSSLKKFFLALVIVLVAFLSFGIGRLSVEGKREPVKILSQEVGSKNQEVGNTNQTAAVINTIQGSTLNEGEVYASSKGTKYYYSYCKSTVSDKNKVIFSTAKMAESAGYTLSTTCKPK